MQAACSDDELLGDQPCHQAKSTEPAAAAGAGEKSGKDKSKAKGKAKGKAQGKRKAGKSATQRGDSSRSSGGTKKKLVLKNAKGTAANNFPATTSIRTRASARLATSAPDASNGCAMSRSRMNGSRNWRSQIQGQHTPFYASTTSTSPKIGKRISSRS